MAAEPAGSQCPQVPLTLLKDPNYVFRVPEGCPYGIPTPVITSSVPEETEPAP